MDRKNHFAKRLISVFCIASSCALFCMLAGCEEEMMTQSDNAIEHEHDTEVGLDGIAEAAREARATLDERFAISSLEMASDEPYVVSDEEVAMAVEEIAVEEPVIQTVMDTLEPVAVAAIETVIITPVNTVEDLIAGDPEEEAAIAEEDVVNSEEEAFIADEKEAIAVLAQNIDLKIPTPAENAELLKEIEISVPSLDNMHIATAPLVSDNGKDELEKPEIIGEDAEAVDTEAITEPILEAKTEQPVDEDESKGFFRKIGSTVGNAVGNFTARHYFILGAAMVFVAALIYLRNKNMVSFTPWRKK